MENGAQPGGGSIVVLVIQLAIVVLMIAAYWKMFAKAGRPGWAAIVPIYNVIVLLDIAGKPAWWVILFLIPIVNIVIMILALVGLAQNFGKGAGFAIGMLLLPFIFIPILGFGSAEYQGA